jgi:hypothetical protein
MYVVCRIRIDESPATSAIRIHCHPLAQFSFDVLRQPTWSHPRCLDIIAIRLELRCPLYNYAAIESLVGDIILLSGSCRCYSFSSLTCHARFGQPLSFILHLLFDVQDIHLSILPLPYIDLSSIQSHSYSYYHLQSSCDTTLLTPFSLLKVTASKASPILIRQLFYCQL